MNSFKVDIKLPLVESFCTREKRTPESYPALHVLYVHHFLKASYLDRMKLGVL